MLTQEFDATAAGTWTLGDMPVNRIGFGTKRLAGSPEDAIAILRRAVEYGVNHIDTAAFYPMYDNDATAKRELGTSNELIARALAPYSDDLCIATKVGPTPDGMATAEQLPGLVEDNLRQLGRDQLDLVYLRQHGLKTVDDHFGVLAELRRAGKIRHLGISNVRPELLAQAQRIAPVVAVQNRYGVDFGRVNDEMLRICEQQQIAFVPFFALTGSGREAGGVADNRIVDEIAAAHSATPAQVRSAWTLSQGAHVLAIPGTSNLDHLAQNIAAGSLRLSSQELAALESTATQK
jgi:pyridoxine 4-dehydrogenase